MIDNFTFNSYYIYKALCDLEIKATMAESNDTSDSSSGGSWWEGWLQTAKEKSYSALDVAREKSLAAFDIAKEKSYSAVDMIKKDLEEFSNTMSHDTGEAVAKTSESLRETLKTENTEAARDKLKQGISSFLDGLTRLLVVEAEDKEAPIVKMKTTDPIFDRAKARLHAIQVDPGTYCSYPTGSTEKYEEWLKAFEMDSRKGEISELLVSQVEVRGLYTRLVPSEISHADFWRRYFYKVHQLQVDEARKLALMKRAEQTEKKEDTINWDEEDSSCGEDEIEQPSTANKTNKTQDKPQPSKENKTEESQNKQQCPVENSTNKTQNIPQKPYTPKNETIKTETESTTERRVEQVDKKLDALQSAQNDTVIQSDTKPCVKTGNENSEETKTLDSKQIVNKTDESCVQNKEGDVKIETNKCDKTESETENKNSADEENQQDMEEIRTKEKGDIVVVNPDRDSPSTESTKESADDDWERDFDVELTEEDLKAADEIAKKLNLSSADYTKLSAEMEEDWESWD